MANKRISRKLRRGSVLVEFAITAPLLFMILFAALELGHANMILNVSEAAAYEGARAGVVPGATQQEVINATTEILQISSIQGASINVTPANLQQSTDFIEVEIVVPYSANTLIPPFFTQGMVIERDCKLTRENVD